MQQFYLGRVHKNVRTVMCQLADQEERPSSIWDDIWLLVCFAVYSLIIVGWLLL